LISNNTTLYGPELDWVAYGAINEFKKYSADLKRYLGPFIHDIEQTSTKDELLQSIVRIFQLWIDNPLRPPRVILTGPPGSGKSTQGRILAKKFGMNFISVRKLLEDEIKAKNKNSVWIRESIANGIPIDDDIVIPLVEKELKTSAS